MITEADVPAITGLAVHSRAGAALGLVESVFRDAANDEPLFALVNQEAGRTVVPLLHAELEGAALVVPYTDEQLRTAPPLANELDLTPEQEQRVFEHYGIATPPPE
ncbi:MAG: hypothetical protein JWO12_3401 [Frankiales bacterium]|jgi:hypothetical protein|nr:hypothetical protein [Frankiales bacterium]